MYYITRADDKGIYKIGVQALKNFKPEDGVEYYVRKTRKLPSFFDSVPVYLGVDGKLKKTNREATGWCDGYYG